MREATTTKRKLFKNKRIRSAELAPIERGDVQTHLGDESVHGLGAGDSFYLHDFIGAPEAAQIFDRLVHEIDFVPMFNFAPEMTKAIPIPRLVSAQTGKGDGVEAMYRMPGSNQSNIHTRPWTNTVREICIRAERVIDLELNHSVCSLFRDQDDSLGFHHDKMVDLADRSLILSLSFGAARPMIIEEVNGDRRHTVVLRPGSLLAIGPETNERFVHAIPKLYEPVGPRISLSVRQSSTFVDQANGRLVGKGQAHQTRNYPFTKSYEDLDQCSDEAMQTIESCHRAAADLLTELRRKHPVVRDPAT